MAAPRFYLPPELCTGEVLRLEGREAHHALHVLRVKRGEPVVILDGWGHEFLCEITDASRNAMTLLVKQKNSSRPPSGRITLLQALPRGKIIESIIQKAVELGAHRIVPLLTERVVTHLDENEGTNKREKWQQVAIEAIKQCGAAWLPDIEKPTTLEAFLARRNAGPEASAQSSTFNLQPSTFDLSLVGSLQTGRRHPRECFQEFQTRYGRRPQSVAVWIGPEGDFTPDELKLIEASGALPISLGSLTLRVETAAIFCLSILAYELSR
jgi:16S rRNA (uracil1498-N3)-methyltransferase